MTPTIQEGMALRPERQAGRSRWRILIAVVVVAALGSLTAVGVVYARRPHERGATPLYIGAQPVRDPGSVIIGAVFGGLAESRR